MLQVRGAPGLRRKPRPRRLTGWTGRYTLHSRLYFVIFMLYITRREHAVCVSIYVRVSGRWAEARAVVARPWSAASPRSAWAA